MRRGSGSEGGVGVARIAGRSRSVDSGRSCSIVAVVVEFVVGE